MDDDPRYFGGRNLSCKPVRYILESRPQLSAGLAANRCLGSACSRSLTKAPRHKLFSVAAIARSVFIVAAAVFAI
jgi:hypothetical protein